MTDTTDRVYETILVLRCQAGDEAAFAELVERYQPRLRYYAAGRAQLQNDWQAWDYAVDLAAGSTLACLVALLLAAVCTMLLISFSSCDPAADQRQPRGNLADNQRVG